MIVLQRSIPGAIGALQRIFGNFLTLAVIITAMV